MADTAEQANLNSSSGIPRIVKVLEYIPIVWELGSLVACFDSYVLEPLNVLRSILKPMWGE